MIYGFAAIVVLILSIACVNYMNLVTARAMVRAREVSLRKVVGATRSQLSPVHGAIGDHGVWSPWPCSKSCCPPLTACLPRRFQALADWPLTLVIIAVALGASDIGACRYRSELPPHLSNGIDSRTQTVASQTH